MTSSYPEPDAPQIDAGRLWAGGLATAVVAALVAEVGILVARGLLHLAVFAPIGDGLWGDANNTTYAIGVGVIALAATGLLHLLVGTTPSGTVFFGWIMGLLTVVAVVIPLKVIGTSTEIIATTVLNALIGLAITTLLTSVANGARSRSRQQYRQAAYESREW
ncbi:DUF6069 family protein [Streptomyces sp. RB6PN25]|uniref:DUF6069 family protein n=1 Tax=Streptomyces humicola TaxID=2953240 RepID=A0ABT1PXG8_9ACTN|nr:DUF6069 family protein [Streptomyces humicola]MCQ4081685.1 DUF6069 family protein [Streptomyces humicola]